MHTDTRRFIARILLFSGLLQSCHSPQIAGVAEEVTTVSVESTDHHDTDANPHTLRRRVRSVEPTPETSAGDSTTTPSKSLKLSDVTQIAQVGNPSCATAVTSPRIYTGTSFFDDLVLESDVFVDKSLFIKEFLESGDSVSVIARPRLWGKSLNMDMLRRFLTIQVDKQGRPRPPEESLDRKLFVGGKVVIGPVTGKVKQLSPLKIAQHCPNIISNYQGKYPVISIGLKDVRGSSYQEIQKSIKRRILKLYSEYLYLEQYTKEDTADFLTNSDKEQLRRYFNGKLRKSDIKDSLFFLSKLLHKHFGKQVYILIDEYDAPINKAYLEYANRPKRFAKILRLFRDLLGSALRDNPYLKQGLMTGILTIARADLFPDLDNLWDCTLLDEKFITAYGITQQEVDELLNKVLIATPADRIQQWYNGYKLRGHVIYNTWSVMSCLSRKGKLDYYWMDSGGTKLIYSVMGSEEMQQRLKALVSERSITSSIIHPMCFDDIGKPEGFYSLLIFAGYLNPESVTPERNIYRLSIPNQEARYIYQNRFIKSEPSAENRIDCRVA
ncbi:MAG: AAA family ATPase [Bacteroidota bacterium]